MISDKKYNRAGKNRSRRLEILKYVCVYGKYVPWGKTRQLVNICKGLSEYGHFWNIFCMGKYYWTIDNLLRPENKRRISFCEGDIHCSHHHRHNHDYHRLTITATITITITIPITITITIIHCEKSRLAKRWQKVVLVSQPKLLWPK